jgi:predicted amidophosphoribosyltransferase
MGDKAYKQLHRELGLCDNCPKPAIKRKNLCADCTYRKSLQNKKYVIANRKKILENAADLIKFRIANGLCRECGNPLDPDADEGHVTCMNCVSNSKERKRKCR